MNLHYISRVPLLRLLFPVTLFLAVFLVHGLTLADEVLFDPASAQEDSQEQAGKRFYSGLDISYINFEADNDPGSDAAAYGLMMVAGYRLGEYLSIEGGANWLPLADPAIPIPIPLMWTPAEKGFYLNLAGGLRLNLTRYSSSRVVPWVSLWYAGHYVISDYSVNGSGPTYGAGLEWKTRTGKRRQVSVRIHDFDGNLEVKDNSGNMDYGRTDIRAVEFAITIFGG